MATKKKAGRKSRSPRCKTCGKTIRTPAGWSHGAATRTHYWRYHREVMTGEEAGS